MISLLDLQRMNSFIFLRRNKFQIYYLTSKILWDATLNADNLLNCYQNSVCTSLKYGILEEWGSFHSIDVNTFNFQLNFALSIRIKCELFFKYILEIFGFR